MRSTRIAVIALTLIWAFSMLGPVVADVKLGPPPGSYRPMPVTLSDEPTEELSAQPEYVAAPLYGALNIGDGEDSTYSVAIDLGEDWEEFKTAYADANGEVELQTCPARVYVDANNDEDLTNDGPGVLSRCIEDRRKPGDYTIFVGARCDVTYGDGLELTYPINLYMFPQRGKTRFKDGTERDYGRLAFAYCAGSFETDLDVAGEALSARFYDRDADGLIMADAGDQVNLDLNADGVFDGNSKGPEMYGLRDPFHFNGETYVLETFGARGDAPTVTVSETKVETKPYILKGEVAPDFTQPTLDGGDFTLSAHRGKVILLDFWATWCGPCLEELPNVVSMWEKLEGDDFMIVGISFDRDDDKGKATDKVAKFAPENGMTWTHIVEGKYWDSDVGDIYQVSGIPQTVLVGEDGTILEVGLRGDRLRKACKTATRP
ncbi:MAG TPA: TlpA disulfide reductase family protein [Armatimonadota bacterium]|nr:TlpA disulfide reductase family protein [Armatimonadota bacterium]